MTDSKKYDPTTGTWTTPDADLEDTGVVLEEPTNAEPDTDDSEDISGDVSDDVSAEDDPDALETVPESFNAKLHSGFRSQRERRARILFEGTSTDERTEEDGS